MLRLGKTAGEDEQTHLGDMWVGMVCQSGGGAGSEEAGNHRLQCTRDFFHFYFAGPDLMSNVPSGGELM